MHQAADLWSVRGAGVRKESDAIGRNRTQSDAMGGGMARRVRRARPSDRAAAISRNSVGVTWVQVRVRVRVRVRARGWQRRSLGTAWAPPSSCGGVGGCAAQRFAARLQDAPPQSCSAARLAETASRATRRCRACAGRRKACAARRKACAGRRKACAGRRKACAAPFGTRARCWRARARCWRARARCERAWARRMPRLDAMPQSPWLAALLRCSSLAALLRSP